MRAVDADKLETRIQESFYRHYSKSHSQQLNDFYRCVIKKIRNSEEIEMESVKYGHWIYNDVLIRSPWARNCHCSECGFEPMERGNYCPNCGVKMRKEDV